MGSGMGLGSGDQTFGGAGIIGVAPASKKQSIMIYKKKDHYTEWEFVYDPLTDVRTMGGGSGQGGLAGGNPEQNGNSPTGFGGAPGSNGFSGGGIGGPGSGLGGSQGIGGGPGMGGDLGGPGSGGNNPSPKPPQQEIPQQ